jgi:uncharacterized LabA/DUF88 family protein
MPIPNFSDPHATYIYVDGESHYIRSTACIKDLLGPNADLTQITTLDKSDAAKIHVYPQSNFFWDDHLILQIGVGEQHIRRRVYFAAIPGDSPAVYRAQVSFRNAGFEPQVIKELSQATKQRKAILETDAVIDKPKGVDIMLAVRMLEDAYRNNYQQCLLFTSDVDYLPAIQAVRQFGKQVVVFGFNKGLAADSPFLHAPDYFVDLTKEMKRWYTLKIPSP